MSQDAKAAERARLAEALRANLRRRKAAAAGREPPAPAAPQGEAPEPAPDGER